MSKKIYSFFLILPLILFIPCTAKCEINSDSNNPLYNEKVDSVQVFKNYDNTLSLSKEDINLMAKVVYAESRSEPYEGQIAVACVILNRLKNPEFPKTVTDVVMQKNAFSCVNDGSISCDPTNSNYSAVFEALFGNDPTSHAVFFYNPKISTSEWMKNSDKKNLKVIGQHVFFSN